jgi:HEAT repeat protein
MSNGDDEPADAPEDADEEAPADAEETAADENGDVEPKVTAETLEERLDDAEADLEAAETEAALDAVEANLDGVEADLENADLPEPDDEDEEDPAEAIQSRIDDLRSDLEDQRGPYAGDVQASVDDSAATIRDTRWTENGEPEVRAAAEEFLVTASDELGRTFGPEGDGLDTHAAALEEAGATVADEGLDPDEDADTIATLLEAAEELEAALEAAEEWSDLTVVQQLEKQGFYDRLNPANHKDYPPERNVVRIAERENDPERIVTALEHFESDFMEDVALEALERMGSPEAFDLLHERAKKRGRKEIQVLGKIGDERAVDTLLDFVNSDNPPLQKVTIRALGEIGSAEATQEIADALEDDEPTVRYQAARSFGLLGDTRAVDPLRDRLENAEDDQLRAACAWALVQIGTEDALEAAAEHDDDRAYTVQAEAKKARDATGA